MNTSKRVLLVGTNVRNVAKSAKNAGYSVYSLTKYTDEDLKLYSTVEEIKGDRKWVKRKTEELAEKYNFEVVLCAGYEDLNVKADILGSHPEESAKVKDKLKFYKTLEKNGTEMPFPELNPESSDVIFKPRKGGGGEKVFLRKKGEDKSEIEKFKEDEYICQRFIKGIPCSVSLIAGEEIVPVATNLILAGWEEMNASRFRYCGNITPFVPKSDMGKELIRTAIETVEIFEMRGSVGVDFILADKPYVLEVNPRFQGSLDSIEWSHDLNLFSLHVCGVEGKKFNLNKPKRLAGRTVLFSPFDVQIKTNFIGNPYFADIPANGVYKSHDPLISIISSGKSVDNVKSSLVHWRDVFYKYNRIKKTY